MAKANNASIAKFGHCTRLVSERKVSIENKTLIAIRMAANQ